MLARSSAASASAADLAAPSCFSRAVSLGREALLLRLDRPFALLREALLVVGKDGVVAVAARRLLDGGHGLTAGDQGEGRVLHGLGRPDVELGMVEGDFGGLFLWGIPQVKLGVVDLDCGVVLAVGDSLQSGQVFVGDPVATLTLHGKQSIRRSIACSLARGYRRHGRSPVENLIGLESLFGMFGEPFRDLRVAFDINGKQVCRVSFADNTTAIKSVSISGFLCVVICWCFS